MHETLSTMMAGRFFSISTNWNVVNPPKILGYLSVLQP